MIWQCLCDSEAGVTHTHTQKHTTDGHKENEKVETSLTLEKVNFQ